VYVIPSASKAAFNFSLYFSIFVSSAQTAKVIAATVLLVLVEIRSAIRLALEAFLY
jgi:hypothetical protein